MMPALRTIRITKVQPFANHTGSREWVEVSGRCVRADGSHGADVPVGYTEDPHAQDTLYLAQRGSGFVTVGVVPGYLGDRIVTVEEVGEL